RRDSTRRKGTRVVNDTGLLFEVEDELVARPARRVPSPVVGASETDLTPVAGVALWGPLLDRLNVVAEADRRALRPIGPGGYTGGECYRALSEICLAGGDFLADRSLLADPATAALRGANALPSVPTLWRFLAGADLGRVATAAAVNRVMLRRAWAAGAAPDGHRLTIDPDATRVAVYGPGKEGSAFSRTGLTALSPLVGVLGETGDVLAVRARGGAANDGRAMGSFIDECVAAIPAGAREGYRLWIRVDSAGYQDQVLAAAERHGADFTVTAKQYAPVADRILALAHNVGLWLRTLGLPKEYRRARGKRLRVGFLNVAARLVRHGRRLHLRFGSAYAHLQAFVTALERLRALPAFG